MSVDKNLHVCLSTTNPYTDQPLGDPSGFRKTPFYTLLIQHEEGKPACLRLKTPVMSEMSTDTEDATYVTVWYEDHASPTPWVLLFAGVRQSVTHHALDTQWVFEAKQPQAAALAPLEGLAWMENNAHLALYHPPWDSSGADLLNTNPYTLYWDRCRGDVGLSHWIQGQKCWDIQNQYDPAWFSVVETTPVVKVRVQVTFQWMQHVMTYRDIAGDIVQACAHEGLGPGDAIGTLTHEALEHGWPESGKILGPGCFVAHSQLTHRRDQSWPAWVHIPLDHEQHLMARCAWYDATLVVGTMSHYPRQEDVCYTLASALPLEGHTVDIAVELPKNWSLYEEIPSWHPWEQYENGDKVQHQGWVYVYREPSAMTDLKDLQEEGIALQRFEHEPVSQQGTWIVHPEDSQRVRPMVCDSFVEQEMGKALLYHSLQRAKVELIKGMRSHRVHGRGTIADWHAMSLQDEISLSPHSGQPAIRAKLVAYELSFDAMLGGGYVHIQGAFCAPVPQVAKTPMAGWREDWAAYDITPQGMLPQPQPAPELPKPRVQVAHGLAEQIQHIHETCVPETSYLPHLRARETRIRIKMSPARGLDKSVRRITLQVGKRFHPLWS